MRHRGRGGPSRLRPHPRGRQRGMVTVELAIGTITAVTVTACLVSLLMLGVAQAACAESSAQLARQSARGDEIAVAGARERAPDGARIRISRQADGVLAEVAVDVGVLGVGDVEVRAGAWAAYEPGQGP